MEANDVEKTKLDVNDGRTIGRMIISLDFGTVFSKAAWMLVETDTVLAELRRDQFDTHNIHDIRFQDDGGLPTEMAYCKDQWHYGSEVKTLRKSGQIPVSSRIKLIKLGLAEARHTKKIISTLDKQIENLPLQSRVTDRLGLVAVFLRELNRQVRSKIFQNFGTEDVWRLYTVETLLTVPACWKPDMIVKMKTAANQAGLESVKLVSEPEAAAMWIKYNEPAPPGPLGKTRSKQSKPFLLLDVGGGTAVSSVTWSLSLRG